jgi:signal transduction histidine kinase/CheY-like chemotaxis protein
MMWAFFQNLLDTSLFAPHGICLLWEPGLIWLHVGSDVLTALAYFSIPVVLTIFVMRRRDVEFGWIFWAFAIFIMACGLTHVLSIITLWVPIYGIQGIVKAITAVASVITAAILWPLLPRLLAIPSPAQLHEAQLALVEEGRYRREAEDMLRQSQKMEAIGHLTGGVAHDFNNLLTIIRSAVDLMRRRDLPEERRTRYLAAISETVDRAAKLTGQLLAFARRQPLNPEIFDAGRQVENVADMVRPIVGARIEIDLRLCEEPCFAQADIGQFETALINLAVNARDAMDGEGRLTITIDHVDALPQLRGHLRRPGEFVSVTVKDTGCGIAAERLEQIFEPFYTTKEVGKGTGLGLSQVFGFAKQSNGEIEVTSEVGRGSTFTIYLPRAQHAPLARMGSPLTHEPRADGARVLVVEDNEAVGQFSTEMLQDLGYATTWVANAKEALDMLAKDERRFDLVFTDVIMPGMNGVDLARTVSERHPGLPVVLTSGYSDAQAENRGGAFQLIQKPYSVEALSRVLRAASGDRSIPIRKKP